MHSLNSNYLDAFFMVAQTKHFTKASKLLNITQSALSQRVQKLEEELQATLIIRSKSGVQLTEEGYSLLRYCQNKFQLEQEVLNELGQADKKNFHNISGFLRIGGFSSVMRSLILPKLANLMQLHPNVKLKMINREIYELQDLLNSGEIDYAITYEPILTNSCENIKIGDEINKLIKHKDYDGAKIYIDHDENDVITKKILNKKSFKINERIFLDDVYGLIDGVKNKMGLAVIPIHLIKNEKKLVTVKPEKKIKIPIYINFHKQNYYTNLHNEVIRTLKNIN